MKRLGTFIYTLTKSLALQSPAFTYRATRSEVQEKRIFSCVSRTFTSEMQTPSPKLDGSETARGVGSPAGQTATEAVDEMGREGAESEALPNKTEDTSEPKISRRAMKRMKRYQQREAARSGHDAKRRKKEPEKKDRELNFSEKSLKDTEYYFENGLRKVYPYYFTFKTYAKGRWVGQRMLDIFASEFKAYKTETYAEAIKSGRVTVNNQKVGLDYVYKENDFVENIVHRHELPVVGTKLKIIEDSEHFVVVDKPGSIPIHPCGRYRHNSLTYILAIENGYRNLRTIYRLDRLTSGVFIFCKSDSQTRLMQGHIKGRKVEKSYLARVTGEFPSELVTCNEPIDNLTHKIGLFKVGPKGKEAKTTFERLSYNGETSVVLCKPHTGRTHQIRVHLQYIGFPIVNDPLYNSPVWGPERGKGGNFGKPENQLIEDLIKHHTAERFVNDAPLESSSSSVPKDGTGTEVVSSTETAPSNVKTEEREHPTVKPDTSTTECDLKEPVVHHSNDASAEKQLEVSDADSQNDNGFDPEKVTTDPVCEECKRAYVEPRPSDLIMYLHALSYRGPGWFFQTDTPEWANEDWKPNQ